MITLRSRRILRYLSRNVFDGVESLSEAQAFVGRLDGLNCAERLFLECALKSRGNVREFGLLL